MSPDEILGWILVWVAGCLLILGFVGVATYKGDPVMTEDDPEFEAHVEEALRLTLGETAYDLLVCNDIEAAEGWAS